MGTSLFVSYSEHMEYSYSLDNLVMAKMCCDEGKPMPENINFKTGSQVYYSDTLFLEAVAAYFNPICSEKEEIGDLESGFLFSVKVDSVVLWHQLKRGAEKAGRLTEFVEDESKAHNLIDRIYCDYHELEMNSEIKPFGLNIYVEGYFGFYNGFLEELITFDKMLKNELIPKWEGVLFNDSRDHQDRDRQFGTEIRPNRKVG